MEFIDFGLDPKIVNAIAKMGYSDPTPIQKEAIPVILENKDMIGIAQTGTGKTAAFALPIIEKLLKKENDKVRVLILTPTRELATQIRDNIYYYTQNTDIKYTVILGGVKQKIQEKELKKNPDIIIGTPGRTVDLVKQRKIDLRNVETLVLDEADTMLDMGFIHDVKFLISKVPEQRETLLFSATMPKEIKELADEILTDPVVIKTTPDKVTPIKIKQQLYYVDTKNKFNLLLDVLVDNHIKSALVFTRTKHGANKVAEDLESYGVKVSVIHGNKTQQKREKALSDFKKGKTNVLIATDIASRGIDINELSHVINYDMPETPELYVHRIGRTARAGLEGTSISFVSNGELKMLSDVEKLTKNKIEVLENVKYPMVVKEKTFTPKDHKNKSNHKSSGNGGFHKNNQTPFDSEKSNNFHKPNHKSYEKNDRYHQNKSNEGFNNEHKNNFKKKSFHSKKRKPFYGHKPVNK